MKSLKYESKTILNNPYSQTVLLESERIKPDLRRNPGMNNFEVSAEIQREYQNNRRLLQEFWFLKMNDMIRMTLKESVGKIISFRKLNDFFFEGKILDCNDTHLKYDDRKDGVCIISLDEVKTLEGLKWL